MTKAAYLRKSLFEPTVSEKQESVMAGKHHNRQAWGRRRKQRDHIPTTRKQREQIGSRDRIDALRVNLQIHSSSSKSSTPNPPETTLPTGVREFNCLSL